MAEKIHHEDKNKTSAETLAEILEVNQKISKSLKFIKNYFRWKLIWGSIKWLILIVIIVFGFISLKAAVAYVQNYIKSYTEQFGNITQSVNDLKANNLNNVVNTKGR